MGFVHFGKFLTLNQTSFIKFTFFYKKLNSAAKKFEIQGYKRETKVRQVFNER